jgi:hypothetical protein
LGTCSAYSAFNLCAKGGRHDLCFFPRGVKLFTDERKAVITGNSIRYTLEMMLAAILSLTSMMSIAVAVTVVILLSGAALITMAIMTVAG